MQPAQREASTTSSATADDHPGHWWTCRATQENIPDSGVMPSVTAGARSISERWGKGWRREQKHPAELEPALVGRGDGAIRTTAMPATPMDHRSCP